LVTDVGGGPPIGDAAAARAVAIRSAPDAMTNGTPPHDTTGHLQCPFCAAYEVDRLYLATFHLDSCQCVSCGARWDQDAQSGAYRGRASRAWS
jgi:hypothetical protein